MKKIGKNKSGKTANKGANRKDPVRRHPKINQPKAKRTTDQDVEFPGYPPYPPQEDMMTKSNQSGKIDEDIEDIEEITSSALKDRQQQSSKNNSDDRMPAGPEDEIKMEPGNEGDLGDEDIEALGPKDLSLDMGDDEELKHRIWPVDFEGRDLDVPGSELDDRQEDIGSEDEENNSYSLGGDRHEDLDEDKS